MKNCIARTTILAILLSLGLEKPSNALEIYVLTGPGSGAAEANFFGRIDTTTGIYTQIKSFDPVYTANLTWNPSAKNFFVTQRSSTFTTLHTLSMDGTLSNSIGTVGKSIYGMGYRTADSKLYAYDFNNNDTGTIDPATGAWSILNANPGIEAVGPTAGRFTIMGDTLYAAYRSNSPVSYSGFNTLGFEATSSFSYPPISSNAIYQYSVLANDGTNLYAIYGNGVSGEQKLYKITAATGAIESTISLSGTGLYQYFHGAAVPEPSTYALGAIATLLMAFVARCRKLRPKQAFPKPAK